MLQSHVLSYVVGALDFFSLAKPSVDDEFRHARATTSQHFSQGILATPRAQGRLNDFDMHARDGPFCRILRTC
eukprot:468219-Pyramimonas_sp.AAC.1